MGLSRNHAPAVYEIRVEGELDQDWQQWLDGLDVAPSHGSDRAPVTTLTGPVADQAALRGMLCKLWDLNLTLVSVHRVEAGRKEEYEND
jgi:hypothetical protein